MKYSESDIANIKKRADIRDFVPGLSQIGAKFFAKCPQCGKEGKKGMLVTHNMRFDNARCFACNFSLSGSLDAIMHYTGCSFTEAVEKAAQQYGYDLIPSEQKVRNNIRKKSEEIKDSFCLSQLKDSGLTLEDVTAKVLAPNGKDYQFVQTFQKGSLGPTGEVNHFDDEMLIFYYDLYGAPMKFATRGAAGALRQLIRIRWSNPDLHPDKNGKPIKYQSMKGSDARFYISQKIRDAFTNATPIETLFIQEGEKKAEKACKHGIMSLGIQGIFNIGNKDSGLIQDLQYIVKKCQVKNVVLLFDSDWDHLSRNIEQGDDIDQRPNQFAKAAIKFKTYVETLQNVGSYVDVWFGHVNETPAGDKGVDDLLCNTLKGKETELLDDIKVTMKTHNGIGKYANFHKISVLTDIQILDFWHLRNRDEFFARHAESIKNLNTFRFAKIRYNKTESGEFKKSTTLGSDQEFWMVEYNEKGKKECKPDLLIALSFLEANGFARVTSPELGELNYGFIHNDGGVIRYVGDHQVRDFLFEYVMQNCKDRDVLLFFAERLGSFAGKDRLERLKRIEVPEFFEADMQNRYYKNGRLRITAYDIEFGPITTFVWNDNVIKRQFKRTPIIEDITRFSDGTFEIKLTPDGKKCQFLKYLQMTSNFWKDIDRPLTLKEASEWNRHVVNKITALGYLMTDFKYPTESVAIVGMDATMSEVGQSCGRSGKSMIGMALSKVLDQSVIDGKNLKSDDEYMYSTVTPRTRNIFIDDVKPNFNFTKIFQAVAGPLQVNPKTMARFEIPFEKAPKFYITTNHAINDDSPSARDRMVAMSFSNWFNINHTPMMEFGNAFFTQWDEYQWQLFDNLMAECVMYYFRSMMQGWSKQGRGVVTPPMQDLEARTLRQKMGEVFLQWAEVYFDESGTGLNTRVDRKEMYDNFRQEYPGQQQFVTTSNFKTRVLAFCEFKGYHFNPHKRMKGQPMQSFSTWKSGGGTGIYEGDRDSSASHEYFTVTTDQYATETCM